MVPPLSPADADMEQRCHGQRRVNRLACGKDLRSNRIQWKERRRPQRCCAKYELPPGDLKPSRFRGVSNESLSWILEPLRVQGYAMVRLQPREFTLVKELVSQCRKFFACANKYKETFKFYPIPGGYLTPFPGTYELFEFRRGLSRCPSELAQQGMDAFKLLEDLARRVCVEIGRDINIDLATMPTDTSSTLRCIHYDNPIAQLGGSDGGGFLSGPPPLGASVRIVGLEGDLAILNGLSGAVQDTHASSAVISLAAAPEMVISMYGGNRVATIPTANLRMIHANSPGMYPAHADSSLVTVAPQSSLAGLEAKDLRTGEWFNIEELLQPDECLVFVGDPLDYASAHKYRALMHRPAVPCRGKHKKPVARLDEPRISTPFFLYPQASAVLGPKGLPSMTFDDLNGNVGKCRDNFPWKKRSCYYSDLVYGESEGTAKKPPGASAFAS